MLVAVPALLLEAVVMLVVTPTWTARIAPAASWDASSSGLRTVLTDNKAVSGEVCEMWRKRRGHCEAPGALTAMHPS